MPDIARSSPFRVRLDNRSDHTSDAEVDRPTNVRWRVMALVVGLCFVLYLLRTNLAIAAPVMEPSLGITDVQLGLAFAAFSWVYAICQVPAGVACEIAGPRRGMTTLVASWGVITLFSGLIPSTSMVPTWLVVVALVGIRAVLGVTQAAFFPTMQATVLRWLPPDRWALATGQINAGYTLGGAAAGPLIAWLVLAFGWRLSFILTAPFGLIFAGAWWWYFRDDPARHPGVNAAELAVIGRDRAATIARVDWRRDLGGVFVNRDILLLTVSYFLVGYLNAFFYNWFDPFLVKTRHVSVGLAGALTGVLWLVGSVCAIIGGLFCDWLCARRGARMGCRLIGLIGVLLIAPLMLLGARASQPGIIVTLFALAFGLTQLTDAAYWVAAMRVAGPRTAAATGLMNTGSNAAVGFGSLAMPILAHRLGWDQAIASCALFATASAVCWFWISADRVMTEPVAVPATLVPAAGAGSFQG